MGQHLKFDDTSEEAICEMSKVGASISYIMPSVTLLKMLLQVEVPTTKDIKKLRFVKAEEIKCLVSATLLDPWYKGHVFAVDIPHKTKNGRGACHFVCSTKGHCHWRPRTR